jgi:hypothetical protein
MLLCYLWVRLPSPECPQDPTTAGHTLARRAVPTQQNSSMPQIIPLNTSRSQARIQTVCGSRSDRKAKISQKREKGKIFML